MKQTGHVLVTVKGGWAYVTLLFSLLPNIFKIFHNKKSKKEKHLSITNNGTYFLLKKKHTHTLQYIIKYSKNLLLKKI